MNTEILVVSAMILVLILKPSWTFEKDFITNCT